MSEFRLTRESMDLAFDQFMESPDQRRLLMIYNAMTEPDAYDLRLLLGVAFASGMAAASTMIATALVRKRETLQ